MTTLHQAPRPAALPAGQDARAPWTGLLAAEWTKIRSVRSTIWSLLAFVVVAIGFSTLVAIVISHNWDRPGPHPELVQMRSDPTGLIFGAGFGLGQLALGVLGVIVITSEPARGLAGDHRRHPLPHRARPVRAGDRRADQAHGRGDRHRGRADPRGAAAGRPDPRHDRRPRRRLPAHSGRAADRADRAAVRRPAVAVAGVRGGLPVCGPPSCSPPAAGCWTAATPEQIYPNEPAFLVTGRQFA